MKYLLAIIFSLFSVAVTAETHFHQGLIHDLKVFDPIIDGEDRTYVEVKGVEALGSCKKGNSYIRAIIRDSDDKQYSLVLAAALSSKEISISVNESYKNEQGFCYLRNVRIDL